MTESVAYISAFSIPLFEDSHVHQGKVGVYAAEDEDFDEFRGLELAVKFVILPVRCNVCLLALSFVCLFNLSTKDKSDYETYKLLDE